MHVQCGARNRVRVVALRQIIACCVSSSSSSFFFFFVVFVPCPFQFLFCFFFFLLADNDVERFLIAGEIVIIYPVYLAVPILTHFVGIYG